MFGFGAVRQIKEMGPVICATSVMSLIVFISTIILPSDFLKLSIGVPLGVGIYLLMAYLLKIKEIEEVVKIMKPFIVWSL